MMRFKRTVSIFLALCLVVALFPAEVFADGLDNSEVRQLVESGYNTITLEDEGVEVEVPAEAATGGSNDEPTAEDEKLPLPSASIDEPLQPISGPQSADGAVEDQSDHTHITAAGDTEHMLSATQDMDTPVGEETITRIAWIHELAVRFYINQEDYSAFTDVVFSDYSQSEEFYQDAVWAWNMGLFKKNVEMSIKPFDPATREFTAYTLASCLDLGLGNAEASTYPAENDVALSEESQIALNRGWFDGDGTSLDADVGYNEVGVMLSDAEEIVALGEVQEDYANTYEYADGVIEVPKDIHFEISPDESTVTLYSDALWIEAGDDFVVYLDSLPIAYTALAVIQENGSTVISVKKAETSAFAYVDAQGTIPLTAENSEFIPADGVELMSARDGFDYSNGKLSLSTSLGDSKAEVYLDNLRLNHSFSGSGFTVTVSGTWGMSSTLAYKEESISEIPLGQVRVFGVGVIAVKLSFTMGMEMSGNFSGTFSAGASVLSDGTTRAIHNFSVTNCSITGQGSVSASLKVSAGLDILVAQAIVYAEVGLKTQYTSQVKKNSNDETINCQDYKYYLFLTVGVDWR